MSADILPLTFPRGYVVKFRCVDDSSGSRIWVEDVTRAEAARALAVCWRSVMTPTLAWIVSPEGEMVGDPWIRLATPGIVSIPPATTATILIFAASLLT